MELYFKFIEENKEFFNEKIIKSFFSNDDNKRLLDKYLNNDEKAKDELNYKFTEFFLETRIISYISTLSHNYSRQYDASLNGYKKRYPLLLDKTLENSEKTFLEFVSEEMADNYTWNKRESNDFLDLIDNEELFNSFQKLTYKERTILNLFFIECWQIKEIADYFGNTSQNISKMKNKSLKKLKKYY